MLTLNLKSTDLPNLRRLFTKYENDTLAIKEGADEIFTRIDPPVDTGELRSSLTMVQEGQTVRLEARADHAKYVEFGTRDRGPNPFMRSAFNRYKKEAVNKYTRVLKRHKR